MLWCGIVIYLFHFVFEERTTGSMAVRVLQEPQASLAFFFCGVSYTNLLIKDGIQIITLQNLQKWLAKNVNGSHAMVRQIGRSQNVLINICNKISRH